MNPLRWLPLKTWLILALIVIGLIGLLSWRAACTSAEKARGEASVAVATGDALDKVAAETPIIRDDQAEKQREVDQLSGADQPLPPGFGADLERVRKRSSQPRNP